MLCGFKGVESHLVARRIIIVRAGGRKLGAGSGLGGNIESLHVEFFFLLLAGLCFRVRMFCFMYEYCVFMHECFVSCTNIVFSCTNVLFHVRILCFRVQMLFFVYECFFSCTNAFFRVRMLFFVYECMDDVPLMVMAA